MIEDIFAAIPLGFLLAFMIGPVFFVLLETSITKGFRAAAVFDLGVILGDVVFILVAYFSSYRLIQSIKDEPALFIFGGILMFTYGIISYLRLRKNGRIVQEPEVEIIKKDYLSLFIKGFLLNFINIGVLGFWLALIITIGPQLEMDKNRVFTFFSAVLLSYLATDLVKITIAKKLRSCLNLKNILRIKKLICFILMLSGLFLMIQGWFPEKTDFIQSFENNHSIHNTNTVD